MQSAIGDVGKPCALGLMVWLRGAAVGCHSGCCLSVAICRNVVL